MHVNEKKCILCGTCLDSCAHKARHYRDDCDEFISGLKQGKKYSVLVAPSFFLSYPNKYKKILSYLRSLGAKNFYSVGFGADITIWGYLNYLAHSNSVGNIAPLCPTVVNYIEKHLPELLPDIIPIQSPMMCTAIYLKQYKNVQEDLVFLSPCISQKVEIESKRGLGLIRYNVTFKNLVEHIKKQNVDISSYPTANGEMSGDMGSFFLAPGELQEHMEYYLGSEASILQISGERKVYKYLEFLASQFNKQDKSTPALVDILNCEMGCIYGTGTELHRNYEYAAAYQAMAMRNKKHASIKHRNQKELLDSTDRLAYLNDLFKNLRLEDFMCEYENTPRASTVADAETKAMFGSKLSYENLNIIDCNDMAIKLFQAQGKDGYLECFSEMSALQPDFLARDLHEYKNMLAELKAAINREQAASSAKSKFFSNMSHEIRTPLNSIMGLAEIQLKKGGHSPEVEEAFSRIYNSSILLRSIINDVLNLSKLEAGKMEIRPGAYETTSMIMDIAQLNFIHIGNKDIVFNLCVDENLPTCLIGDELRVKQILNNILSNAFKYTTKGTVNLSFRVESAVETDSVTLVACISDTGQGMTKEQIDNLFSEFERFNLEANHAIEGSGLGMFIVHQLIHLMNGSISVHSEPRKGSTFIVRLPQKAKNAEVLGAELVANLQSLENIQKYLKKPVQIGLEPMPYGRVLVVDDMEANLYVAQGCLMPYDLTIETAESGELAVSKIKDGKTYDIIFMDHMMPGMDGIEATKTIRGMGYRHPIVALTANAVGDAEKMFIDNGFSGFLSKPIDLTMLDEYLVRFIRDKQPLEVIEGARNTCLQSAGM